MPSCAGANAEAVAAGRRRFDCTVDGVTYRRARSSRCRVWCLAELRRHFRELPAAVAVQARQRLAAHGCWELLWRVEPLPLLPGQEAELPFRATGKMLEVHR